MNKKNTEEYGMKKKLTAAVAMLLVATIMMVSTTYAWFTLSTAPEVKGISTSVGANGNLEIALADGTDAEPAVSSTTDSMAAQDVELANITWGNLVDLSSATYGLSNVTLMPAKLMVSEDGLSLNDALLQTPEYGYDGRISELKDASTGTYSVDENGFTVNNNVGVRAVGLSNTIPERKSAFRAASNSAKSDAASAKSTATSTLAVNGGALISAALQHSSAGAEDNTDYRPYITKTQAVINALTAANEKVGSVLVNEIKALAASTEENKDKTPPTDFTDAATVEGYLDDIGASNDLKAAFTKYAANKATLASSKVKIDALAATTGSVAWYVDGGDCYKAVMDPLLNADNIKIGDQTIAEAMAACTDDLAKAELAMKLFAHETIVNVPTGSGVFSDLAEVAGAYTADVVITDIVFGAYQLSGLSGKSIRTSIQSNGTNGTDGAVVPAQYFAGVTYTDGDDAVTDLVTDSYGYVLDFWFRTNAADASLLLQTEEAQRVYSDETNVATQGAGSNLTFTFAAGEDPEDYTDLMKAIKIVFFDRTNKTILAYACLDSAYTDDGANKVAKVYLCDKDGNKRTGDDAAKIIKLTKNTATAISALVYLDGESIQNKDVPNAAQALSGTLNLQFATDVILIPMENAGMREAE